MKRDPTKPVLAAGILLLSMPPNPKFLLMQHSKRWDLPKGHAERGETLEETALRETEEETGIGPDQIELDETFRFELTYPVRYKKSGDQVFTKTVTFFLGMVPQVLDVAVTEHLGYRWFAFEPPHRIQEQTIDPLLFAVEQHLSNKPGWES